MFHRQAMLSSSGGIGSTLTGGLQDIAALLPLLGTEQCAEQVSSALTRGYIYAAATPMSIFGSLGVVIAGFKTLIACFSLGDIEGAKILGNMGFEPRGENLSLIMVGAGNAGKGTSTGRYIIETRMDELIKELNVDKNRITGVSHRSVAWNIKMVATTALLCAFSIAPYIYLNLGANSLTKSTTWVFPVLRATGGFITATLIQILIQRRITKLSHQYLVKRDLLHNRDVGAPDELGDTKKYRIDARRIAPTWLLLSFLFIGLVASVVGYVGCFSVVQNSASASGPVSWVCLEAGLSVMRLAIWAWNPTKDGAPPLEIILELDKCEPLPTCNKDNEEILEYKVLPLTRERDFLKIITSFAGLIEPFRNPDLSLYYTFTRKRPSKKSVLWWNNAKKHRLGERTLYITVFEHKERTTRVYTQDVEGDTLYSIKSHAPFVDVEHHLLEVEIDVKIDPKGDPVFCDSNNLDSLRKHHRSILEHIGYRLGTADVTKTYAIENSWTMKVEDSISALQRLREENGHDWERDVEKGREEEQTEESLASDYFMHSSIERERRLLDEKRVKWISRRMEMITKETKERFQSEMGMEYRVNNQAVQKKPATKALEQIEDMLRLGQYMMELLLVCEVREWEQLFLNKFKAFLDRIGKDRLEEKERLTREWRADCWKRLNSLMHAAVKRLADVVKDGDCFLETLGEQWASSIGQFFEGVEKPNLISLSKLRNVMEPLLYQSSSADEIRQQMENEIEDIEFRLKRGILRGQFDQFWDDDTLFRCRYSRSKWLYLDQYSSPTSVPPEIYSHALKGNKNIIHISSRLEVDWFRAAIQDLPWVTSVSSIGLLPTLPAIRRDPLFIKSTNDNLITFANRLKLPVSGDLDPSTYIFTDAGETDMDMSIWPPDRLGNNASVLISFVAPASGQKKNLTLRLKHSGRGDAPLEVTLGSVIQLHPSSKATLTIDDITLHWYPNQVPNHLSFEPGIRNVILIRFKAPAGKHSSFLHDIELRDEYGLWGIREIVSHIRSLSVLSLTRFLSDLVFTHLALLLSSSTFQKCRPKLLKELALVSHSFHQIPCKHLFATVELHDADPNHHLASSKRGFVKLLKGRPDIVKYIPNLTYEVRYLLQRRRLSALTDPSKIPPSNFSSQLSTIQGCTGI